MNYTYKTLLLMIFFSSYQYPINSTINLFLHKYPQFKDKLNEEQVSKYSKKLQQPDYLFKKIVKSTRVATGAKGIMGIYLGFVSLSDHNGQMIFPRKQHKPEVNFLITKAIKPVYMIAPETVHNWMLDPTQPTEMYRFALQHDAPTGLYYVDTKKTDLPHDHMISLDTIVMIANPKNVFVPEGATITHDSPNLILPNIYIRKNFNFEYNALYTLSIKQYFEQINQEYKHDDQSVAMIIS